MAIVRHDGRAAVHGQRLAGDAVALLRRTSSLTRVRARLNGRCQSDVDLTPLLCALARGGLVRRVDGVHYTHAPVQPWRALHVWLICVVDARRRLMRLAPRLLPPALAIRVVRGALHRPLARLLRPKVASALAQLPCSARAEHAERFAAEHIASVATEHALIRVLCEGSPPRVARWVASRVRMEGVERLDAAMRNGPVLLVGLHHDAYPMIVAGLLSHGYRFHAFHHAEDAVNTGFAAAMGHYTRRCGWAAATYYGAARLNGVRDFIAAMRAGECGLSFADHYDPGTTSEPHGEDDYASRVARYRGVEKAVPGVSAVDLAFGGGVLRVHAWSGWLAERTGATMLPVRVHTRGDGQYRVSIGEAVSHRPLPPAGRVSAASATTSILEPLLEDVRRTPARWMYLTSFRSRVPSRDLCAAPTRTRAADG